MYIFKTFFNKLKSLILIISKLNSYFSFNFLYLFYKYYNFIKMLCFKLNYYNYNNIAAFVNIYIFNVNFNIISFINCIYSLFNLIIVFIIVITVVIFIIIFKLKHFILSIIELQ